MSFRNRLTLFFVLIVIVPMVAVAVVLFRLISDNEDGKANARLAAEQNVAINMYKDASARALATLGRVASDEELSAGLQDDDLPAARTRAVALLGAEGARRIVLVRDGAAVIDVGTKKAIAPITRPLADAQRSRRFGDLQLASQDAPTYAAAVRRTTGADAVVVWIDDTQVASTIEGAPAKPPKGRSGDISISDDDYRYATFAAPGMLGSRIRVAVLAPKAETTGQVAKSRIIAGGILAGFFILAVTFAFAVSRSLRGQVMELLDAARRLGRGDFTTRVPAVGGDEFAALGEEFNRMAQQLEERLADLAQERERVQNSMRRLGQAVGSNLDRDALLQLVVQTAVDGVGGEAGRATVRRAAMRRWRSGCASAGSTGSPTRCARPRRAPCARGRPRRPRSATAARSLIRSAAANARGRRRARLGGAFGPRVHRRGARPLPLSRDPGGRLHGERRPARDGRARVRDRRADRPVQPAALRRGARHRGRARQAIRTADGARAARHRRLQAGQRHLRPPAGRRRPARGGPCPAGVLREIDEPARYGGEELAVVLPGTDLHGAYLLAERVRQGVESLKLPLMVAEGDIQVTASLGVAALPESADDQDGLVAAADAAMYDAKRAGKNRAMRAQRDHSL